jgi:dihydrofolate reductase
MKLTTTTFVSVDGVMQGIGGPEEDRGGGFDRGGWTTLLWDNESATFLNQVYERADASLFGRRTYEIFAGSWGVVDDPSINPIATALNTRPRYVASNTLTDPQWADTTVVSGDVAAAVGELKAKPGGELQVHGSGALIRFGCSTTSWSTSSTCSPSQWWSARARDSSPTSAATPRSTSSNRRPPQRGDHPGLPAHRASAVRDVLGRLEARVVGAPRAPVLNPTDLRPRCTSAWNPCSWACLRTSSSKGEL